MAHHAIDISTDNRRLGDLANRLFYPFLLIGLAGAGVSLGIGFTAQEGPDRFLQGWLVNFCFFTAIALGGLFFTLVQHATHAGWSVTVRRLAEGLAANLPWMAIFFLPLLWAVIAAEHEIFTWTHPDVRETDHLVQHKAPYLNTTFFIIRAGIYFFIWTVLSRLFFTLSVKQDASGDVELTHRMTTFSYPGIILFALTLTFAAFDWLMSQDAHWFSTIFGVYYFAGAVGSCMATCILAFAFLQRAGRLTQSITIDHYHDLGKLLFAFSIVFWAYIAFSQYMLQWYGNIPEETLWWQARASGHPDPITYHGHTFTPGAWNNWTLFLLLGHFVVPFVCIISRVPKRRKALLVIAAAWMFLMCWYDLFWLVMPLFHPDHPGFALTDFTSMVGIGGLFFALFINRMRRVSLVPDHDPRLAEAIAFENM